MDRRGSGEGNLATRRSLAQAPRMGVGRRGGALDGAESRCMSTSPGQPMAPPWTGETGRIRPRDAAVPRPGVADGVSRRGRTRVRRVERCVPPSPGTMVLLADSAMEGARETAHGRRPRYVVLMCGECAGGARGRQPRHVVAIFAVVVVLRRECVEGAHPRHVVADGVSGMEGPPGAAHGGQHRRVVAGGESGMKGSPGAAHERQPRHVVASDESDVRGSPGAARERQPRRVIASHESGMKCSRGVAHEGQPGASSLVVSPA